MKNYKFKIKSIKTMDKELCKFMKVCKICGELKLMIKFSKDAKLKDDISGGNVAAPIFGRIIEQVAPILNVVPYIERID